jgi:hypothetical protein
MQRRTFLGALGGATILGGGYVAWELFAPESATVVDDDRVGGSDTGDDGEDGENSDDGTESFTEAGDSDGTGSGTNADDGSAGATVLKTGEFVGKDNHECSGTVEVARDDDGTFLQFREYEQTQGPDVYCYVTPDPDPDTSAEIDAGTKVRIDDGADDGEMTKTGTFSQSLSPEVDVDGAMGVGVWCDDFSVPFGAATLEDA